MRWACNARIRICGSEIQGFSSLEMTVLRRGRNKGGKKAGEGARPTLQFPTLTTLQNLSDKNVRPTRAYLDANAGSSLPDLNVS